MVVEQVIVLLHSSFLLARVSQWDETAVARCFYNVSIGLLASWQFFAPKSIASIRFGVFLRSRA